MHYDKKNDLKAHLIREKIENLRKKSVDAIIQENINISEEIGFTLRAVISPTDYPYTEQLDFNPYDFDDFFKQLINRNYSLYSKNQSILFFDPLGSITDYSVFLNPIIPDKWMCIRKRNRFNNIIIKQDGVIFFITSQNDVIDDKVKLDLDYLSIHLEIFFSQIITEIYEKMKYSNRLNVKIECFGLSDCYIQSGDHPESINLPRNSSNIFSKSYILNLQNPIKINNIIILDIRRLFEFQNRLI